METTEFIDREPTHPGRKKLRIISQTADEMLVDEVFADEPTQVGTAINADVMRKFQQGIVDANTKSDSANTKADNAVATANSADTKATNAFSTATTASQEATAATTTATQALTDAQEALTQVVQKMGTKIFFGTNTTPETSINFTSNPQSQINSKLNATAQAVDSAKLGGKTESQLSVSYAQSSGNSSSCSTSVNLSGDQTITGTKTFSGTVNANALKVAGRSAETIVSSSLGTNGYIKYSSGLIIQWVNVCGSNEQTVNFPISFTSASSYKLAHCVICGSSGATTGVSYRNNAYQKTATSFKCYGSDSANGGYDYIAIGY